MNTSLCCFSLLSVLHIERFWHQQLIFVLYFSERASFRVSHTQTHTHKHTQTKSHTNTHKQTDTHKQMIETSPFSPSVYHRNGSLITLNRRNNTHGDLSIRVISGRKTTISKRATTHIPFRNTAYPSKLSLEIMFSYKNVLAMRASTSQVCFLKYRCTYLSKFFSMLWGCITN